MLALLFPGQGSQRPQMGLAWCDHPSWAVVGRLSAATGQDLAALLLEAGADTLRATANAQPAVYALSAVVLDAARRAGLGAAAVTAVAGHSLGEYTALVAAGVLTPEDGARLVSSRACAMQVAADATPGTMAAVLGLEPHLVEQVCDRIEGAWTANDNAPGQVVIAGTAAGVAAAGVAAKELGAKRVLPLAVGGAFHSPLMAPARARLDAALARAPWASAQLPVVANVDATAHTRGWARLLSAQLVAPVRWRQSLLTLAGLGVDRFVELGPGAELSGMVKRTITDATRVNVATPEDLSRL